MLIKTLGDFEADSPPLEASEIPQPQPAAGEVLIRVSRCAVCRTDLDIIAGRTPPPALPVVPGHQVVGFVESGALAAGGLQPGQRVGVAWFASACGECEFCKSERENLCPQFKATGRDVNGGYAEYMTARADAVFPIPDSFSDSEAAPLLCGGAIGYRALRLTNLQDGQTLGLMGFGGSNHLVLKLAQYLFPRSKIYVFSRSPQERELARALGADWAGAIEETPPREMEAVVEATPVWLPVLAALKILKPGGRLVVNAIRKEEQDKEAWMGLNYPEHLWMEKEIKSVANVARADAREFLQIAAEARIKPEFEEYKLQDSNYALLEMKQGKIRGSKVLRVSE